MWGPIQGSRTGSSNAMAQSPRRVKSIFVALPNRVDPDSGIRPGKGLEPR
jgi:hypothetical protein